MPSLSRCLLCVAMVPLLAAAMAPIFLLPPGMFAADGTATATAAAIRASIRAPAPPDRFAALPPLPDSIPSQLGWVRVTRVAKPLCGDSPTNEVLILGCFNRETRALEVGTQLSLAQSWQTLEHERVHMILWDAGLKVNDAGEEQLADVIGTARVLEMVMR